jgi:type I restriction enzyme S subunit
MTTCVLKDLIEISKDGEWGKAEPSEDSVEMLCIRGTDFNDVRFGSTNTTPRRHIVKRIAERKMLQPWDLLIEAAGGTKNQITGRTVLLRPKLFSESELPVTCASFSRFIRLKTDLCDPEFMFWYLQYLYSAGFMHAYHTQHTGVSRFQWTTFSEREPLELPPLAVQRRIAGILSAYDELIDNSQRRIRILEEMARALYREWFVHFRFPGHEKIKQVNSSLGPIPSGWEVKTFGELYDTSSGGTPSRKRIDYFENGTIDWVKSQELLDGFILSTDERITKLGLKESSAKLFPANTVLIALYGATIGKLAILSRDATTNQACCAVLPKSEPFGREFAFLTLLENRERIIGLRLGAAQQNISQVLVRALECMKPPHDLVRRFSGKMSSVFDAILNLQRQTSNLRRTRDLLLPRLLSGQVNLRPNL